MLEKEPEISKLIMGISLIEGLFALVAAGIQIFTRMSESQITQQYIIICPNIYLCALFLWSFLAWIYNCSSADSRHPHRITSFLKNLETWVGAENHILQLTITLATAFLSLITILLVFQTSGSHYLNSLQVVGRDLLSLNVWCILLTVQFFILLLFKYPGIYRKPGFLDARAISRILLLQLVILLPVLHWTILVYRLPVFDIIPGWFWKFQVKSYSTRDLLALAMFSIFVLATVFIFKQPSRRIRNLLLLCALGYILQIGFGFIEGNGFESIRLKYAASYHKSYAEHASDRPEIMNALWNYEEKYSKEIYLGTKPPGVLLVYILTQKVSALFTPQNSFNDRFLGLTALIAYVYPLISMLTLLALYLFARSFLKEEDSYLPIVFYLICPNVILIPLFLDQVLYPLLLMLLMVLLSFTIRYRSMKIAVVCGFFSYVSLYFTFTMLPVIPLAVLWIVAELVINGLGWKKACWLLSGIILGVLFGYLLFRFALNYDFIPRYQAAFDRHRQIKIYDPGIKNMLLSILVNNIDIAAWTGFPIFIFFTWLGARGLLNLVVEWVKHPKPFSIKSLMINSNPTAIRLTSFLVAFYLTYIGLNLFGQTRGEVGRIWLFMVPVFCLVASLEVRVLCKRKYIGIYMVIIIQWITIFLTYKYQDFFA